MIALIPLVTGGFAFRGVQSADAEPPATQTVTRDAAGRISRIEGPGYSVSRAPSDTREAESRARAASQTAPSPTRRRLQAPVVCARGDRLELSEVELVAEGSGVIARDGCELRLSGVEVRAGGWALVAEAGARVRVDASILEGKIGSVDAAPGASVSAWSTMFRGPPGRALHAPEFIDRGGNAWD